jgi:hypothetical protein
MHGYQNDFFMWIISNDCLCTLHSIVEFMLLKIKIHFSSHIVYEF